MRSHRVPIVVAALLVHLAGCVAEQRRLPGDAGAQAARIIAQEVQDLAFAGKLPEAEQMLADAATGFAPESQAGAILGYTRSWLLYQQSRSASDDARAALLRESVANTKAVLAVHPGFSAALDSFSKDMIGLGEPDAALTFLREHTGTPGLDADGRAATWIAIARVHGAEERWDEAADALMRAYRVGNERGKVAELLVSLTGVGAGRLAAAVERFYRDGQVQPALAGDERLIGRYLAAGDVPAADRSLVRWLHAAGATKAFDLERFAGLPEAVDGAARSALLGELGALMAQVRRGIELDEHEETTVAKRYADGLPAWCKKPARREALALGLQSLASKLDERADDVGDAERDRGIAGLYEIALELALRSGDAAEQPAEDAPAELAVEVDHDVGLDIAIDLAVFYNNHRDLEDADGVTGVSQERFRRLVRDSTKDPSSRGLAKGPLSLDVWNEIEPRIPKEQRIRYWGLVGLVFSDTGWLTADEDRELAIRYLRNAIAVGREEGRRLPYYETKLAEVLAITDRPVRSLDAYVGATRSYLASTERRTGRGTARRALREGETARAELDGRIRELELLLHPRDGIYVGGSFGWTDGNESGGELQGELNRRTPAGRDVSVSLDDTDLGYKGYVGYRFEMPFALELGYTGLEGPNSRIDATVVDPMLVPDIAELHPLTGRGPTLSVLAYPYERGRLSTFVRLGYWYWQADVDITLSGMNIKRSPDGWDFLVGAGAQYRLFADLGVRVDYERYFLDDSGVDMLSVGLVWKF